MKNETLLTAIVATAFIILVLIIGVVFTIVLARKQKLRQDLKEANYQAKISEITFSALQSQMNPHFIFNCLNSIKYFTEQNNNKAASEYLTKFASLIRKTLDNARRERISLEEEIASLKLYLELEAMRFKEKLGYTIDIAGNVDTEFIELPPMLLQPHIENAIWHGLMPKDDGGEINISIWQDNDAAVFVKIKDNGIGRSASFEINRNNQQGRISYGTKITGERIALLNERFNTKVAEVKIIDEQNQNGLPLGTTVVIKLPIK